MAKSNESFAFKILIIGESSVGKSCLMTRFVDETFQSAFLPTIGVDFKVRTLMIDNYPCKVQIWDTAGQERFRVITTTYYRDAAGVLIVYDVTNGGSFASVRRWLDEINKYCEDSIPKLLVGNKDDIIPINKNSISKEVTTQEAENFAREMNLPFFETSAKDNKNVTEAFYALTRLALQKRLQARDQQKPSANNGQANATPLSQSIKDTAGQERFRSITNSYYRGADGIIIVYDVTDSETFVHLKDRFLEIQQFCDSDVPKILVGNKDDANNQQNKAVLSDDARQFAEKYNLLFFEISVKNSKNIADVFNAIARLALKRRLEQSDSMSSNIGVKRIQKNKTVDNSTNRKCCNT
ncbi:unnamed protein product [Rotaria magnacalcarata]|uniref:Uncharacterized protein n=2 Tax=Rotaria magnacalcarata TaxID=392030 RepID=A0A820AHB5_9BILA|nr:unnamed protein product [Rotaria magnacalcarata]CAF4058741.1 unnamed protein product [Rotaria magnacalcarata]CAF4185497.1 unnamed protein product [Rotaria magnacalcarata]